MFKAYKYKRKKMFFTMLEFISLILFIMGIGLQILAQRSMGIYRDLVYRNQILAESILSHKLLWIYKWNSLIVIGISIVVLINNKKFSLIINPYFNWIGSLLKIIILSSILYTLISYYHLNTWIAYPWIILSVIFAAAIQYIKLIYGFILTKNR